MRSTCTLVKLAREKCCVPLAYYSDPSSCRILVVGYSYISQGRIVPHACAVIGRMQRCQDMSRKKEYSFRRMDMARGVENIETLIRKSPGKQERVSNEWF